MSLYRGEKLISGMMVGKTVISDVELQEKSVTPTKSPQIITPDANFDGLSKVNIGAVPDNYIDTSDANATSADMLVDSSGYVDGVKVEGSVPRNGAVSKSLNCGESYTIPEGHHNGLGKVTSNSLASQTPGNAGADQIMSGYSAWVNGLKVDGNASKGSAYEIVEYAGSSSLSQTQTVRTSLKNASHWVGMSTRTFSSAPQYDYIVGVIDGQFYCYTDSRSLVASGTATFSNGVLTLNNGQYGYVYAATMSILFVE